MQYFIFLSHFKRAMCCILTSVQRALSLTRSEFSKSIIMHHENGQVARTQLICFHFLYRRLYPKMVELSRSMAMYTNTEMTDV